MAYKKVHWTRDPLAHWVDLRADASITGKLLLLHFMTELLALHLVISYQVKCGTIVSAIEIIPDLIKHASTQTWMMHLIRMKPITVI